MNRAYASYSEVASHVTIDVIKAARCDEELESLRRSVKEMTTLFAKLISGNSDSGLYFLL